MNNVKITNVELIPIRAQNGLTFFASCVLDNKLFVGNIAVFSKLDGSGFRCVYPTKVLHNGHQIPIFYPTDSSISEEIEKAISEKATDLMLSAVNNDSDSGLEGGEKND